MKIKRLVTTISAKTYHVITLSGHCKHCVSWLYINMQTTTTKFKYTTALALHSKKTFQSLKYFTYVKENKIQKLFFLVYNLAPNVTLMINAAIYITKIIGRPIFPFEYICSVNLSSFSNSWCIIPQF